MLMQSHLQSVVQIKIAADAEYNIQNKMHTISNIWQLAIFKMNSLKNFMHINYII